MQMMSGAPEIILFTWLLLSAMMAGQTFWSGYRWRWNWSVPGRFTVVVVLVGALAAAQLLPFLELLQHSERSSQTRRCRERHAASSASRKTLPPR